MRKKPAGKFMKSANRSIAMSLTHGPIPFIAAAGFLIILSLFAPTTIGNLRTSINDLAAPISAAIYKPIIATQTLINDITGLGDIRAEVTTLRAENERLRAWYHQAQTLQADNQRLKELAQFTPPKGFEMQSAAVLTDLSSGYVRSLMIEAGTAQGVNKGAAVLDHNGLIGRVVEAGKNVSRVLLINDINARIPVTIEGADIPAIMSGQNDVMPYLIHLPADTKPEIGARLVTSGDGGLLPRGLPVGLVSENMSVKPYADPRHTMIVNIIHYKAPGLR